MSDQDETPQSEPSVEPHHTAEETREDAEGHVIRGHLDSGEVEPPAARGNIDEEEDVEGHSCRAATDAPSEVGPDWALRHGVQAEEDV